MFGLATFSYANADQAGRRLAAVQLVTTVIASVAEVASADAEEDVDLVVLAPPVPRTTPASVA